MSLTNDECESLITLELNKAHETSTVMSIMLKKLSYTKMRYADLYN